MAKIEQEVKELKNAVNELSSKIDRLNFQLIQILNKVNESGAAAAEAPSASPGAGMPVDLSPLEDRIDQMAKVMLTKADLEPIVQELAKIRDERLKEAEESIDNVTVLLEKGLALTELTASLKEIEAHLMELVSPRKK